MKALVVDCSAFLACVLPDEQPADGLLEVISDAEFVVPALWPVEVANVMLMALRRKRADESTLAAVRADLMARPIEVEAALVSRALDGTMTVARECRLTVYDAAYLELAQRRHLPLVTLDDDLRRAAKKAGVEVPEPK